MQRFFRACNAAFAAHAPAAARSLAVSTFHVEPLAPRVGLVSWVPRARILLDYYLGEHKEMCLRPLASGS